ncbi:MAG: hypothetical protein MN733_40965, partial [Nitrososphaera sp.]|nr:hypothetical protein [Nitrososphaera sp.]
DKFAWLSTKRAALEGFRKSGGTFVYSSYGHLQHPRTYSSSRKAYYWNNILPIIEDPKAHYVHGKLIANWGALQKEIPVEIKTNY